MSTSVANRGSLSVIEFVPFRFHFVFPRCLLDLRLCPKQHQVESAISAKAEIIHSFMVGSGPAENHRRV